MSPTEIRLDRAFLDRVRRFAVVVNAIGLVVVLVLFVGVAVLLAGSGAAGSVTSVGLAALFALVPLAQGLQLWWLVRTWRRDRSVEVPVELDDDGVRLHAWFGTVAAPWEAVTAVTLEGRATGAVLRVRTDPARPGVRWQLDSERHRRLLTRHGMRYAARILLVEPDRLAWLVHEHSAGRVQVVRR